MGSRWRHGRGVPPRGGAGQGGGGAVGCCEVGFEEPTLVDGRGGKEALCEAAGGRTARRPCSSFLCPASGGSGSVHRVQCWSQAADRPAQPLPTATNSSPAFSAATPAAAAPSRLAWASRPPPPPTAGTLRGQKTRSRVWTSSTACPVQGSPKEARCNAAGGACLGGRGRRCLGGEWFWGVSQNDHGRCLAPYFEAGLTTAHPSAENAR
jgi:hypothetical protein